MSPDYVLASWLTEFGYLRYPSPEAVRKAFRVARAERGADRLARELTAHEARKIARRLVTRVA